MGHSEHSKKLKMIIVEDYFYELAKELEREEDFTMLPYSTLLDSSSFKKKTNYGKRWSKEIRSKLKLEFNESINKEHYVPNVFHYLKKVNQPLDFDIKDTIEKDSNRLSNPKLSHQVSEILKAVAQSYKVSYTQGMHNWALLLMEEIGNRVEVYECMCIMMVSKKYEFHRLFYISDKTFLVNLCKITIQLIKKYLPAVYKKINHDDESVYLYFRDWMLSLFHKILPSKRKIIFDLIILNGYLALPIIAFSIIQRMKNVILKSKLISAEELIFMGFSTYEHVFTDRFILNVKQNVDSMFNTAVQILKKNLEEEE